MSDHPAVATLSSEEIARRRYLEDTTWRRMRRATGDFIRRRPLGTVGAVIVILMILAAVFAENVAPYTDEDAIFTGLPTAPDSARTSSATRACSS